MSKKHRKHKGKHTHRNKFFKWKRKFNKLHLSLRGAILTFICYLLIYSPISIKLRNNVLGINLAFGLEIILFVFMFIGIYLIFIGFF